MFLPCHIRCCPSLLIPSTERSVRETDNTWLLLLRVTHSLGRQLLILMFLGHDTNNTRMEILELDNHPFYVATQYHPEYLSRPLKPSAPFMGLILASVGILKPYLEHCNSSKSSDVSEESGKTSSSCFLRYK